MASIAGLFAAANTAPLLPLNFSSAQNVLPVATLAPHKATSAEAGTNPNTLIPTTLPSPPQVIIETKYITQLRTVASLYITVTRTLRPETPSPPDRTQSQTPPAIQSQHPNTVPIPSPNPHVIASSASIPQPKPTRLEGAASSSSSQPQISPTTPAAGSSTPIVPSPSPPAPATAASGSTLLGTPKASSLPGIAPNMSAPQPGSGGLPSPNPDPQVQTGPPGGLPMGPPDPADGAFAGGVPNKNLDLPLTLMFMALFMLGAYVHLTIYRQNAKRGHKFLISDIIFEFCVLRVVTCIFRITWSIAATRGVILVAVITANAGGSLMFAVNIFFAQRLVRSIHPKAGWCTVFGQFTTMLLFSVPIFIILAIVSTSVSFFSVGNIDRLEMTDNLLKFASSWNTGLSIFPVLVVSACLSVPGPEVEKFGTGSQRVKTALLYAGAFLMITGQSIRLYALFNKERPGTTNVVYSKAVFYTTGFMFEILVVALYAILRVDQRFHIPDGSSGPGDYSGDKQRGQYSVEEIERLVGSLEVPHQIMRERKGPEDMDMVFTIFFATKKNGSGDMEGKSSLSDETVVGGQLGDLELPVRPKRITRRETLMEAIRMPPRPPVASTTNPDIPGNYRRMDGARYPPPRPRRPSMYSQFETGGSYYVRNQKNWGAAPPCGIEKGPEKF